MIEFLQDLRYGLRILRKNPTFAIVVVMTLALGIGANVAIFTAIDLVMLKSLPVRNPDVLVLLLKNDVESAEKMWKANLA